MLRRAIHSGILGLLVAAVLVLTGGYYTQRIEARAAAPVVVPTALPPSPAATPEPSPPPAPVPTPLPTPVPRSTAGLDAQVAQLARAAGARTGVALIELGGSQPLTWSYQGDASFTAASTYKLPLLMDQAQLLAAGSARPGDELCFTDADWEDGWFADYADGSCFSRQQLASRVGQQSDNTAAHMMVDSIGGGGALNAYAAGHGATESQFYDPNLTTANDLARLLADEASGRAGGAAAQQWLYPLLTHTAYEAGIPAGTPAGTTVVHKIGILDGEVNDAAFVPNGPHGAYVLVVMTDGPGGGAGWDLVAAVSRTVWSYEASRS